jgi:nucleotide-binding universal stress UspA family protein
MALKNLLLSIDTDRAAPARYDLAIQLAQAHEARLTGLFVRQMVISQGLPGGSAVGLNEQFRQAVAAQNAEFEHAERAAIDSFTEPARAAGIAFDHHIEDGVGAGSAVPYLVQYARTADLVILGKAESNGRNIAHDVVFGGGVPVIVVPPVEHDGIGQRVAIAWNGSREAARAVKDALPILERAASVTILCVNQLAAGQNAQPGDDLARALRSHGIDAAVDNVVRKGQSVGDAIVSRLSDIGADLLVMGAWGHSRLREFVLGGVTRRVLEQSPVPVLVSH